MPDFEPARFHQLAGVAAAAGTALLTAPALCAACGTARLLRRGYAQLGADGDGYEDRDGVATEHSIRAFSDTRPRIAACLSAVVGLGASIAAPIVAAGAAADGSPVLLPSELSSWAEPACWVRPALLLPAGPTCLDRR